MRIKVTSTIGDLASDMAAIPVKFATEAPPLVRRHVEAGNTLAQGFAKRSAGPHGSAYWKRITSEMTGPLEGEFGPHGDVVGNAVGAGWRHAAPNTDLPRAADIVGSKFAKSVGDMADGLFW